MQADLYCSPNAGRSVLLTKCRQICTAHKFYSDDQIKKMRWPGQLSRMRKRRGVYRVLVEKPE
jgi:hypothetical protein